MRNSNHAGIALLSALAMGTGCELIGGIEDRYPPEPAAVSSSVAASGAGGGATGSTAMAAGGTGGTASGTGGGTASGAGGGAGAGTGGSPACGPSGTVVPVPDSATQFCSHTTRSDLCPDPTMPYYGQDGNTHVNVPTYQLSQAPEQTLTDCTTGLVWQVEVVTASDLSWDSAVQLCDNLQYAGMDDWRLPSRRELISLLDLGRPAFSNGTAPVFPVELSGLVMPAPANPVYWTSTQYSGSPTDTAWAVRLIGSAIEPLAKDGTPEGRALCVRGPERYKNPVFVSTAETVTDEATGLIWERAGANTARWDNALAYCNALNLAGKQDWRVPTMKELAYLADDSRMSPAIDTVAFPNTQPGEYWSSSASSADPSKSWTVDFNDGRAQTRSTNSWFRLRCVRTNP